MPETLVETGNRYAMRNLAIAIIGLQLFDIVIHVATDQIEWMRIASNIIIMAWVSALLWGRLSTHVHLVSYGALIAYTLLNALFVARYGVTNPAQDDAPRIVLFILVLFTLGLSMWLIQTHAPKEKLSE